MTNREERLFQELKEYAETKGLYLEGFIPAKCPVYVLNLSYLSKDNDPFYPIDRAIIHILRSNPLTREIPYIAWLLGFEKEIIESRIKYHLLEEGFMMVGSQGEYIVTEAGAKKYLTKNGDRPDVQVTGSIMVDGTTLRLLPQRYYDSDNALRFYRRVQTAIPHIPIMGNDDPVITKAVKSIEKTIRATRFSYGLEENAHSLEIMSFDERVIEDAIITFFSDKNGKIMKKLYFCGKETEIDALKGVVERYSFFFDENGNLHNNGGITRDDLSSIVLRENIENFAKAIINRYGVGKAMAKVDIIKNLILKNGGHYILQMPKNLLTYSANKRQILADAKQGFIAFRPFQQENGIYIVATDPDKSIRFLLDFENELISWKDKNGQVDINFIKDITKDKSFDWRKVLCEIGRFDDLENIDRKQFFKFE